MERKDQYVAKLHATIDAWSAKVDQVEAKVKAKRADAQQQYRRTITTFQTRLADLKARARALEEAGEDTWDAIKKSVEVGIEEFKREYTSARQDRNLEELEALPAAGESGAPDETPEAQT